MSFKNLKANRAEEITNLTSKIAELNKSNNPKDERYWKPTADKAGNGFAIIRFLPAPVNEDLPFVQLWTHNFSIGGDKENKGGRYYIENCLSTLGKDDPVNDYNKKLWDSEVKANRDFVSQKTKRKLSYISNIYVIQDKANPENEGKVFLFSYGKKIFQKLNDAMNPDPNDEDEVAMNPFDLWEGANFKLKFSVVEGQRSYEKSSFEKQSALLGGDDEKLEEIYNSEYSLLAEVAPDKFKTYEVLKEQLHRVLGNAAEGIGNTVSKPTEKVTRKPKDTARQIVEDGEDDPELEAFYAKLGSSTSSADLDDSIPF